MISGNIREDSLLKQRDKAAVRARHAVLVFNLMVGCGALMIALAIAYFVYINIPLSLR